MFQLIQDDLLHPYCGGNKLRKLDAIMPQLKHEGVSDVVSRSCNLASMTGSRQPPVCIILR